MSNEKMDDFEAVKYIAEKGMKIKNADDLRDLIEEVKNNFNYDYSVAPRAAGAACVAVAKYLAREMGLTVFQANFLTWGFIFGFQCPNNKTGLKIIDFDDMLYPQYEHKFDKSISRETWETIQETAKQYYQERNNITSPQVKAHWESIINGVVPFGYTIKE